MHLLTIVLIFTDSSTNIKSVKWAMMWQQQAQLDKALLCSDVKLK